MIVQAPQPVTTISKETASAIPSSGFRVAVRETGKVLGWATLPAWWPIREMGRDTLRLRNSLWLIPKGQILTRVRKFRADVDEFDKATPEEQTRLLRLDLAWFLVVVVCVLASLTVGNYLPILAMGLAFWARGHSAHIGSKALPHFDVLRWALGYDQLPEPEPTILERFRHRASDEAPE